MYSRGVVRRPSHPLDAMNVFIGCGNDKVSVSLSIADLNAPVYLSQGDSV